MDPAPDAPTPADGAAEPGGRSWSGSSIRWISGERCASNGADAIWRGIEPIDGPASGARVVSGAESVVAESTGDPAWSPGDPAWSPGDPAWPPASARAVTSAGSGAPGSSRSDVWEPASDRTGTGSAAVPDPFVAR
jgi:hypothetical protein